MSLSIFSKIVRGEVPSYKIFEDDLTLAFLDNNPLTEGHVLVIPKQEIDHLDECPPELYEAVFRTVYKVSNHLKQVLKPKRIALVVHGFDVPHAHVHVVPIYTGNEMRLADRSKSIISPEALAASAAKIKTVGNE